QLKQLLVETEKLSAEVLGLRGRSAQLQLQLEVRTGPSVTSCHSESPSVTLTLPVPLQVQQKQHRDTVAVYRSHLLQAAQGFMDEGVHTALLRILRAEAGVG
ncbi:ANR35 protein, partial [Sterrhoptilus dennistouni]|nr:ANR35 protein [Sterrhoptilus dennistouni]